MSLQIEEEQQVGDASVAQAAPLPRQGNGPAGAATAQEMDTAFQGRRLMEEDDLFMQRKQWFTDMRGKLMNMALVAASVTYQAGLNPPGGFWQDNPADKSHHVGDPVLRDGHHRRYLIFYYFNGTAFVTSLVILVMQTSERFYHTEAKVQALIFTIFVDLASLVGAYVAGTTSSPSSSIYVIVITCACVAFVGVIYVGGWMTQICFSVIATFPCCIPMLNSRWVPIPHRLVEIARKNRERREAERRNNPRTCFPCCAQPRVAA